MAVRGDTGTNKQRTKGLVSKGIEVLTLEEEALTFEDESLTGNCDVS